MKQKKMKMVSMKKKCLVIAMTGLMLCSLVACGGKYSDSATSDMNYGMMQSNNGSKYEYGYNAEESYDMVTEDSGAMEEAPTGDSANGVDVSTNRKLIRTVSMDVETEEFETMMTNVEDKVASMGGYIEHAYTYNGSAYHSGRTRYAEMTVRVPDAKLENFVDQVAGFSNVVSKTTSTEDITLEYVDTEGLRDMYLAEETSLLALLEKAETVEDISYLTSRLSEVRYNIENLESRLLKYDDLVEYATIHLYIEEVEVYTPVVTEEKSFGEEVKEGFMASLHDIWNSIVRFVKNLLIDLPYIIRFFVIVGLIVLAIRLIIVIIKKVIKKKKAKKTVCQNSVMTERKEMPAEVVSPKDAVQTEGSEERTSETKTGQE